MGRCVWMLGIVAVLMCGCGSGSTAVPTAVEPEPTGEQLLGSTVMGEGIILGPANDPTRVPPFDTVFQLGHLDPGVPFLVENFDQVDITPPLPVYGHGQQFEHRPGDSEAIDAFLAMLTNGVDDTLVKSLVFPPDENAIAANGQEESKMIEDRPAWLTGPDLMGSDVTRFVIDIEHVGWGEQAVNLYTWRARVYFYGMP